VKPAIRRPILVLEQFVNPLSLSLRLFGNIFAGGIMLALIGLIPLYAMWAPNILWKAFDMIIGVIQAFIFSLLTILYFGMAASGHGSHDDEGHAAHDADAAHGEEAAHDETKEGVLQPA